MRVPVAMLAAVLVAPALGVDGTGSVAPPAWGEAYVIEYGPESRVRVNQRVDCVDGRSAIVTLTAHSNLEVRPMSASYCWSDARIVAKAGPIGPVYSPSLYRPEPGPSGTGGEISPSNSTHPYGTLVVYILSSEGGSNSAEVIVKDGRIVESYRARQVVWPWAEATGVIYAGGPLVGVSALYDVRYIAESDLVGFYWDDFLPLGGTVLYERSTPDGNRSCTGRCMDGFAGGPGEYRVSYAYHGVLDSGPLVLAEFPTAAERAAGAS